MLGHGTLILELILSDPNYKGHVDRFSRGQNWLVGVVQLTRTSSEGGVVNEPHSHFVCLGTFFSGHASAPPNSVLSVQGRMHCCNCQVEALQFPSGYLRLHING